MFTRLVRIVILSAIILALAQVFPAQVLAQAQPKRSTRIAYILGARVYTVNVDGSDRQLIADDIYYGDPAWSPDGKQIAAEGWGSFDSAVSNRLYVMNVDGSNIHPVTEGGASAFNASRPKWSPDGQHILFQGFNRIGGGGSAIYIMKPDGSELQPLTDKAVTIDPERAAWSPDGKLIAFSAYKDALGLEDIYVMNPDGSDVRRLTDSTGRKASSLHPAWSPDGKQFAYMSDLDGAYEIYIMNADGRHARHLTSNLGWACCPDWSPDGSKIAFVSDLADGADSVYVVNLDGKGLRRVTSGLDPAWQP